MAQFKYVGHNHGLPAPTGGKIVVRGNKKPLNDEAFEFQVDPDEVFEVPDGWTRAVVSLEGTSHPFDKTKKLYERIS
jgi:hypothetical protein